MKTLTASSSNAFTPPLQSQSFTSFSKEQLYQLSVDENQLRQLLISVLTPTGLSPGPLIWQDGEAEAIVHIDRIRAAIKPGFVVCELKMETDQSGMGSLVMAFKIGRTPGEATLTVTTESLPRGNPELVHRWGVIAQEEFWSALMASGRKLLSKIINSKSAKEPALELNGLCCDAAALSFVYGHPVDASEIQAYTQELRKEGLDPGEVTFNPQPVNIAEPGAGDASIWQRLCIEWRRLLQQFDRFIRALADAAVRKFRQLFG